jgi:hypothetical protein
MTTAAAVIQELRQLADSRYYAARRSILLTAVETLERLSAQLEAWQKTFPDKTAEEIALTFATADWCIRANGKLMAENERLREQRPLTAEEKAWIEKAWQEYKAIPRTSAEQQAKVDALGEKIWNHNFGPDVKRRP